MSLRAVGGRLRAAFSRYDLALLVFGALAALDTQHFMARPDHSWVLAVVPVMALALLLRSRPLLGGAMLIVASLILRFATLGVGYGDQIDLAHTAASIAATGGNPYGRIIFNGAPYSYGPLGLIWWLPGTPLEFLSAVAGMLILLRLRAWVTLAVFGAFPYSVELTFIGVNDYSVGLLITVALLVLARHAVLGSAMLAASAAIKPYAVAWFLPAIGFTGWVGAATLLTTSAVLWLPVLIAWTPAAFIRSTLIVEHTRSVTPLPSAGSMNMPLLRLMALPLSALGLIVRNWRFMVLMGSATFFVFLFFSPWTSSGYWIALFPITGIAIERGNSWIRDEVSVEGHTLAGDAPLEVGVPA